MEHLDVWYMILERTDHPDTFQATYLVCQDFAEYYETYGHHLKVDYANYGTYLLIKFPKAEWNWEILSKSECICLEFKVKNSHLPWEWNIVPKGKIAWTTLVKYATYSTAYFMSSHKHLDWNYVLEHPYRNWDWDYFARKISFDLLDKLPETCRRKLLISEFYYRELTQSFFDNNIGWLKPYICSLKLNHLKLPWDIFENRTIYYTLSKKLTEHPDFPIEWFDRKKIPYVRWDIIARRQDISFSKLCELVARQNVNIRVCEYDNGYEVNGWEYLSERDDVDWEVVESFINMNWNWSILSAKPGFPVDFPSRHPEIDWKYMYHANSNVISYKVIALWDIDFSQDVNYKELSRRIAKIKK